MPISVFSNCKPAACCLLAAALLSACGGGSSAGAGGTDSRTYQQGYAQGTVDTLDIVLEDLQALQTSLAGSGAPAQTSRGALGRSFALLEPRQRETLAASLLTFIARVTEARDAADAAGAGRTEAEAAQAAADEALRALQLVVAADTAARAGGGEAAQTAAINALNAIARVDSAAPDATTRINEALDAALRAAEAEVARLERELAAAEAALAALGQQQVSDTGVVADLRRRLNAARASLASAERALGRGDATPARASLARVSVEYFARTDAAGDALSASDLLQIPVAGVAYAAGKTVLTAGRDAADEYPVRGTMYRHFLRPATSATTEVVSLYGSDRPVKYRLVRQGAADTRALRGTETAWNSFHPRVRTSIRFDALGNPVVSQGSEPGEGWINSDLEREQATACSSIADTCNDATASDIRIAFGARTDGGDPTGEPARYWRKAVPWPRVDQDPNTPGLQDHPFYREAKPTSRCAPGDAGCVVAGAAAANTRAPHARPEQDSVYELLLSSYAPDLNGTPETADDAGRYLSYAAYGLWRYADAFWRQVYLAGAPYGYGSPVARYQTLHFGLDAFGSHNPLPTQASDSFKGTFEGATMGWVVHASGDRTRGHIGGLTRLRGTAELTAHIGTVESKTNRVSGAMRNFEYWNGIAWASAAGAAASVGGWEPIKSLRGLVITLAEADIGADGAFAGATSTSSRTTASNSHILHASYWGEGAYEGAFYGPAGGLEAAGTWFLPADDKGGSRTDIHFNAIGGLVGSFGAACEQPCRPAPTP